MNRTLIIGDVHGGYKSLMQVLEKSKFDQTKDTLVFLGDLVDGRWGDSLKVCRYIADLMFEAEMDSSLKKPILIMGNHDKWFIEVLEEFDCEIYGEAAFYWVQTEKNIWYSQGGRSTYNSFRLAKDIDEIKYIKKYVFDKMHLYYHDNIQNILYVHGGWNMKLGFSETKLFTPKEYYWNRELYEQVIKIYKRQPKSHIEENFGGFDRIYIGHTSTTFYNIHEPVLTCNVVNLDTGGGWEGKLSIYCHETDEYWQSDKVAKLYNQKSS